MQRWREALSAVEAALSDPLRPPPAPRGHLALLRRQLLGALLRRLDSRLFGRLLLGGGAGEEAAEAALGGMPEGPPAAGPPLDPALLPFPAAGGLSFGAGVALKIAVSALAQWAEGAGVKADRGAGGGGGGGAQRSTDAGDYRLLPCLRATADLLMMPKHVLADAEIRGEVLPGLPLPAICALLARFEPDEAAPDPLPPGE